MILAKSSVGATGESTLIKQEAGTTTIMETEQEVSEARAIKLRGWCVTSEEPGALIQVEFLDKASGTVLGHVRLEKTIAGSCTNVFLVPQGISGGPDGINVSTGEVIVKRTGKSLVTLYYEQQ